MVDVIQKPTTVAQAQAEHFSGLCAAVNEDKNIVLLCFVDGDIEWGQEMPAELAEAFARAILRKVKEARR